MGHYDHFRCRLAAFEIGREQAVKLDANLCFYCTHSEEPVCILKYASKGL